MNLPKQSSERHDRPEDFEGWALDPACFTSDDVPALLLWIEDLEDELEEAHRVHKPIKGGPPPEWDAWIIALPDRAFLDCLGPSDRDDPHRATQRSRRREPHTGIKAPRVPGRLQRATLIPRWQ